MVTLVKKTIETENHRRIMLRDQIEEPKENLSIQIPMGDNVIILCLIFESYIYIFLHSSFLTILRRNRFQRTILLAIYKVPTNDKPG